MRFWFALLVAITGLARAEEPAPRRHTDGMIPSLLEANAWINSAPVSAEQLRGKVVVIDFWTYTCINWRRTAPYLRAWFERYGGAGLELVGVHSPEFAFERDVDNVRQAVRDIGVPYPVAVDSDHTIWRAFDNQYWPALYIFDAQGRLRHQQSGEERYDEAERVIRELLEEAGGHDLGAGQTRVDARGAEEPADWRDLRTAETYVGSEREESFASPGGVVRGQPHRYAVSSRLERSEWALSGPWTVEPDRAVAGAAGAKIAFRFHARDLNVVMGPEVRGRPIRFRVRLDGQPPAAARGVDVDEGGDGALREQRMYQLIRQPGPIEDRLFEIEVLEPGAAAFSFTFG